MTYNKRISEMDIQKPSKRIVLLDKKDDFVLCIDGQVIKDVVAYQLTRLASESAVQLSISVSVATDDIDVEIEL